MNAAIEVHELTKSYGPVAAVDRVSFVIQPGELVGFLGPNGAGKSTVMRMLTTYLPATTGSAKIAGFDVMYQSDDVRKNIGYLPESVPLYGEMRVEEYLHFRAKLKAVDREKRTVRVEECLEKCRIREVRRRLLSTLSKGYRQRVGLADALISDPPILILDEPTSGLDPIQIDETLKTIRGLGGKHTILFSHHILPEVEKVCDRVIMIKRGRIRFDEKLSEIAKREPTVIVEVRGPEEAILKAISSAPHVLKTLKIPTDQQEANIVRYRIDAESGHDIREPLAKMLTGNGWGLRKIDFSRETLEDTFTNVMLRD
jgi:ABC-2 type transport system ATP-binding protein